MAQRQNTPNFNRFRDRRSRFKKPERVNVIELVLFIHRNFEEEKKMYSCIVHLYKHYEQRERGRLNLLVLPSSHCSADVATTRSPSTRTIDEIKHGHIGFRRRRNIKNCYQYTQCRSMTAVVRGGKRKLNK